MNKPITQLSTYLYRMLFIFISVGFIALTSCESDESPQELELLNSLIILNFQDSIETGATSDFDIEYSISDPYIATIENNIIKGRHVGRTSIIVTSNNISKGMRVEVLSVNKLFDLPVRDYSNGKEYYLGEYNYLYDETDSTLVFRQDSYKDGVNYFLHCNFTDQNTTESALITFDHEVAHNAYFTLIENYELFDYTDDSFLFGNALNEDDVTEIVFLKTNLENLHCSIYFTQVENPNLTIQEIVNEKFY